MGRPRWFVLALAVLAASPARADDAAPAPPRGITAAELRARPRLDARQRAAMRDACTKGLPACDRLLLLGTLERTMVARALERRGLVIDPAPEGKTVHRLHVFTAPVFGEDEQIFEWANFFHIRSKEYVIEREILLRPGEPWSQETIDETQRKLRDPIFTSVAILVPVVAGPDAPPGSVDVFAVTRDIFSLRMNSNYEYQDGRFTFLTLSLSENNFLGRRKLLAVVFLMDQATFNIGPLYIDKNLLGRRHDLRFRGGPIFRRSDYVLEGSDSSFALSRPLWSLDDKWSWTVEGGHRFATERRFFGNDLRTYDAPSTPEDDMLPRVYEQRRWSVGAGVTRAFGEGIEHRVRGAYELQSQRPGLVDAFPGSPAAQADFIANVLPRNERTGVLYAGYEVYAARYREYVDVGSFDLNEDLRLGPRAQVTVGAGLEVLGSDVNFGTASIEGGWTLPWAGDGLATLSASFSTRLQDGRLIDRVPAVGARIVTPPVGIGRLVSEARVVGLYRDEANREVVLGGDGGLRGYPVGFQDGDRSWITQHEYRTRSVRLFLGSRWGLLAFYDAGAAADRVRDLETFHDIGIGIRALGAQLSPDVFRFDLALPLDSYVDQNGNRRPAFAPRFSAGYRQAF